MKDDTPMCEPHETNYVHGYHGGYHDQNRVPHPSRYFKLPKTSPEETMREWMARQTEASERMKDQVVELENRINQGLRNHQAIIENLERQFKYLEKIQPTKSFAHSTNIKPRHEFVYKPPSSQHENDKVDVKFIEEDEI
ncbi:hypothetical protein Tco_1459405 [Tanacetum coccineum]